MTATFSRWVSQVLSDVSVQHLGRQRTGLLELSDPAVARLSAFNVRDRLRSLESASF